MGRSGRGRRRQLPAHSAPGCYVSAAQTREDRRSSDLNRAKGAPIPPSTSPHIPDLAVRGTLSNVCT